MKLEFKVKCFNDKCEEPIISNIELSNEDAKEVYKDLNLNNKTLEEAIILLSTIAKDKEIQFEKIEIYTDWNNKQYFENKTSDLKLNVNTVTEEKLNNLPKELEENEKPKKYTVTFDSYGGSSIDSQIVENDKMATNPTPPTKNGYAFIEWQLENKAFDFNSNITKDITLKATWKKNQSANPVTPPKEETKPIEPVTPTKPEKPKGINYTGRYDMVGDIEYVILNSNGSCETTMGASCSYIINGCPNPLDCVFDTITTVTLKGNDAYRDFFELTKKFELKNCVAGDETGCGIYAIFKRQ